MNLNIKLMLNALLPLALAAAVAVYMNVEIKKIQKNSSKDVQLLLEVEQLNGSLVAVQLSLNSYSANMSSANAYEAKESVNKVGKQIKSLKTKIVLSKHVAELARIEQKYRELSTALGDNKKFSNSVEVKRQSIRTLGIVNDSYLLKQDVQHYYEQGLLKANQISNITFAIIGGLLVMSCFFSWFMIRRLIRPIRQLNAAALRIAEGDLTLQIEPLHSRDEVGQLTESFRKVTSNLRLLIDQIVETSRSLVVSAEEFSKRTDEVGKASKEIAETISEVAVGAGSQAQRIEDSAEAIELMTGSVHNIMHQAGQAENLSSDASDKAVEGNQTIIRMMKQMEAIQKTVQDLEYVMAGLGERSIQVRNIVSIISGISQQTKILSLNAEIEAARAGEYGRGFAVVAEEIQKLAANSTDSTIQIDDLVKKIREELEQALESMGNVTKEVAAGIVTAEQTGGALVHIGTAVKKVVHQMEESTADISRLVSGVEQVQQSIRAVAEIAGQAEFATQQVSASTEEQLSSMEDMLAAANLLTKTAEKLRLQISHFNL